MMNKPLKRTSQEELEALIDSGKKDFSYLDLSGLNFDGIILTGANLRDDDFTGAKVHEARNPHKAITKQFNPCFSNQNWVYFSGKH